METLRDAPDRPGGRRSWLDRLGAFLGRLVPDLSGADFTIRYRPGRPVDVRGKIPRSKVPGIAGFFARDLDPKGPVTVRGTWSGRALRLRITGDLDGADAQRMRNYLLEHLI